MLKRSDRNLNIIFLKGSTSHLVCKDRCGLEVKDWGLKYLKQVSAFGDSGQYFPNYLVLNYFKALTENERKHTS